MDSRQRWKTENVGHSKYRRSGHGIGNRAGKHRRRHAIAQLARAIAYSDLISIIVLRVTASIAIGFVREDLDGVIQVNWPIFAPDIGACPAGIRAEIDGTRATFTCSGPKPQLVHTSSRPSTQRIAPNAQPLIFTSDASVRSTTFGSVFAQPKIIETATQMADLFLNIATL